MIERCRRGRTCRPTATNTTRIDAPARTLRLSLTHTLPPILHIPTGEDERPDADTPACGLALTPLWTADAHASLYATPLITDLFSDGAKEVVAPGFVDDVDVFDAATGARWADGRWPARHGAPVHSSPLTFDIDGDGVDELIVVTYTGDVLAYRDTGERVRTGLAVPRLKVRRGWHEGLAADPTAHDAPDVGSGVDAQEVAAKEAALKEQRDAVAARLAADAAARGGGSSARRRLAQADATPSVADEAKATYDELFGEQQGGGGDEGYLFGDGGGDATPVGDDASTSPTPLPADAVEELLATGLDADEIAALNDRLAGGVVVDGEGRPTGETGADLWGDATETMTRPPPASALSASDAATHILVDAHVLGTPALGDIDGDGVDELVLSVSYFFDKPAWPADRVARELGPGIDLNDYVAAGVVAMRLAGAGGVLPDVATSHVVWATHLDLSTSRTRFQARAFGGPSLGDIDRDGRLEVVVGTGMGFVYVLDGMTGTARDGWPLQMGAIQPAPVLADVDDDGQLDIIAADEAGTVAALAPSGKLLWERHLGAAITAPPSIGDINADGALEIVVGTASGAIHALVAETGVDVAGAWPFRSAGRVVAPITLAPLGDSNNHLRSLAASFDGRLYAIASDGSCADSVDVGEASYAAPLVDDLDGDGTADVLLATMSGALHTFATGVRLDSPLAAVRDASPGGNGPPGARAVRQGVAAVPASRAPRDARGRALPVTFDIVDARPVAALPGGAAPGRGRGPYKVTATLSGVTRSDLGGGDAPIVGVTDTYDAPGRYTVTLPVPRARTTGTVRLEMVDEVS